MKTFFVVDEAYPLFKIGGLGDVGGSLPIALNNLGEDISIILPNHPEIIRDDSWSEAATFSITYDQESLPIIIHSGKLPNSQVKVYLIEEKKYISAHTDASDNHADKFTIFSLAFSHWLSTFNSDHLPDIIHLNDWHAAMIPPILTHMFGYSSSKFLITIHNLMYQGVTGTPILKKLKFPIEKCQILSWDNQDHHINILLEGLLHVDAINTVSDTYSKEILTHEYGEKIDEILSLRKKDIHGILNGLNLEVFNPSTDPHIFKQFDSSSVSDGKRVNKTSLQTELGLGQNPDIPMIGYVGRVDGGQKGIDLIIESIESRELVSSDQQFVFLGTGDPDLEKELHQAAHGKENVHIVTRYDEELAMKIYAASDVMIIPSKFEPCGLIQMIAMRYGSIPIARATGGLKDTISHGENGFLFENYSIQDFTQAVRQALQIVSDQATKESMIQNAMNTDFSWEESAGRYQELYQQITS